MNILIFSNLKFVCMKKNTGPTNYLPAKRLCFLLFAFLVFSMACNKFNERKALRDFDQVNLVDNNHEYSATHTDSTLQNAWGLVFTPTGIAWVNSQAGHVSALYDKDGNTLRPAIKIPSPGDTVGGNPTGIVFNASTTDFLLANALPAKFIFVGVDGVLSGWNGGNNAQLIQNNVATSSYTGLALAASGGANYLYAADFRTGKIDVWDKNFAPVTWMPFKDDHLPWGYSPFNIQAVGTWLYVMYAKVGSDGRDQAGFGDGFVDVFNTDGSFVKRFASRGFLNAPWGVTQAPASFFTDSTDDSQNSGRGHDHEIDQDIILVGNFGDGHINAFTLNGQFLGQLKKHGQPIWIDGLWALSFAPTTATTIDPNRLYFTAGPDKEADGLFGYLIKQ
jgi:uncharacterized protein (TIGR03118 family)